MTVIGVQGIFSLPWLPRTCQKVTSEHGHMSTWQVLRGDVNLHEPTVFKLTAISSFYSVGSLTWSGLHLNCFNLKKHTTEWWALGIHVKGSIFRSQPSSHFFFFFWTFSMEGATEYFNPLCTPVVIQVIPFFLKKLTFNSTSNIQICSWKN